MWSDSVAAGRQPQELAGAVGGGGAGLDGELGEEVDDVGVDGAGAEVEDERDLAVAFAFHEPLEDFAFAAGQAVAAPGDMVERRGAAKGGEELRALEGLHKMRLHE